MRSKLLVGVMGFIAGAGWLFTVDAQPGRRYIAPRSAADPAAAKQPPFSGAVLAGNTLYLSGVLGTGDNAEAAGPLPRRHQNTLRAAGMTMDDLVTVQIFTPDVADYEAFNKVYRTFCKQVSSPCIPRVGPLLNNARFEVLGIAVRR